MKKNPTPPKQSRTSNKTNNTQADYILPPEQLGFEGFPKPSDSATLPRAGTVEFDVLVALLNGPFTHVDWLERGGSWKLSARITDLKNRGFEINSIKIDHECCERPIALFQMTKDSKQAGYRLLRASGVRVAIGGNGGGWMLDDSSASKAKAHAKRAAKQSRSGGRKG